jgi:hypothetical protein
MTASPTQRTLALLRREGYTAAVVERWIPKAGRRADLFGVIDLLAVKPGIVLGVQATAASNVSARVHKALAEPRLRTWLEAGAAFGIIGWARRGPRGRHTTWSATWRVATIRPDGVVQLTSYDQTPPFLKEAVRVAGVRATAEEQDDGETA